MRHHVALTQHPSGHLRTDVFQGCGTGLPCHEKLRSSIFIQISVRFRNCCAKLHICEGDKLFLATYFSKSLLAGCSSFSLNR